MTGDGFFCFTLSAVHTDKLRAGLDGMSRAGKNMDGRNVCRGTVRGKTFGGIGLIIVSRGNVLYPCLTNLRRTVVTIGQAEGL